MIEIKQITEASDAIIDKVSDRIYTHGLQMYT